MLKKLMDLLKRIGRKQEGFTLIELAVIIAVVGILAGVGVMKYIDVTAGAKLTTAQARLADVKSCISMAIAQKGGHATVLDVNTVITKSYGTTAVTAADGVTFSDISKGADGSAIKYSYTTEDVGGVTYITGASMATPSF